MREAFVEKNFQPKTLAVIEKANAIIEGYRAQGYKITLRTVYYRFVEQNLIENSDAAYDRLGSIISDARLAGLIDWEGIEDRLREVDAVPVWESSGEFVNDVPPWYRGDYWGDQECRPEIFLEKDALAGIIEPACRKYRVPVLTCRGYASQTALYDAGTRFRETIDRGQIPIVFHLGDHDPSGIDMTRDIRDRLALFVGEGVQVERLALNMDQIKRLKPPPQPAKKSDDRYRSYVEQYGPKSWELDALKPEFIAELIETAVDNLIDHVAWDKARERELAEREKIRKAARRWEDVQAFLSRPVPKKPEKKKAKHK